MEFVYVKIPVGAALAGREHAIHEALEAALAAAHAGALVGWGASLEDSPLHHAARVAFHRIDIEVTDAAVAAVVLRDGLVALGAPVGTELHDRANGVARRQVLGANGWGPPQPEGGSGAASASRGARPTR